MRPKPSPSGTNGAMKSVTCHIDQAALAAEQPHRHEHADEPAVERHAAFPDLEQVQRVLDECIPVVKHDRADASTDDYAKHRIENQIVDLV